MIRKAEPASIMTFADRFALLGVAPLIALVVTLLPREPVPGETAGAAH